MTRKTDQQRFIDFIAGLPVDGDTALMVRQAPRRKGGKPLLYDDGTPQWTYPAFLPGCEIKPDEAWYMNTGSFVPERMKDRPRAKLENTDYTLVMVLDDIGTKAKVPLLAPTWIMETSPDNYQWGYAFDEQPLRQDYAAAIQAMADAGYTDPGACNPVRNFRIPGSVNLKTAEKFPARLVEFHPERAFKLEDILNAHEVIPAESDTGEYKPVSIADTGNDPVLRWLSDSGVVLSRVKPSGWVEVVCPNHRQHSDGRVDAGYRPVDRVFKCLHGHCVDLNSTAFLAWVAEQGGPVAETGIRDDLLAELHKSTLDKIKPTEAFPDEAARQIAEIQERQLAQLERGQWFERFAYVAVDDAYFDLKLRQEISRSAFNAIYRHIECRSRHNPKRTVEASVWFDQHRQTMDSPVLNRITYAPGEGITVARDGELMGNRWRDARPAIVPGLGAAKQVKRWLDHCEWLTPETAELEHCLNVMAFKVQHPRIKINHAVLHGSDEGRGKDTMWAPFIHAVCGPVNRNRSIVENEDLGSQWGYNLEVEIMILNELREPSDRERRALSNKLKPIIAAPPETLNINRKMLHPYEALNRLLVLGFTNDPVPISIPTQDRRWFCVWSDGGWELRNPAHEAAAAAMWSWYRDGGGYDAIAAWLWQRDVSAFNPGAAPIVTDWKLTLIEQSMTVSESHLADLARLRQGEFARGIVASPFYGLLDRLQGELAGNGPTIRIHPRSLLHALKEAGWLDRGQCASREYWTKKHILVAPEFKDVGRSDLRRMAENLDFTPEQPADSKIVDMKNRRR